jgi:hypothetical protein
MTPPSAKSQISHGNRRLTEDYQAPHIDAAGGSMV